MTTSHECIVVSVGATELNCSKYAVDSYRGRVGRWAAGREEGRKGGVMELLIQTNRDESSSSAIQTHTRISRSSGSIAHDRSGAAEKSTTIFTFSASQLGRTNIWFYRNNAAIAALISAL